MGAMFNHKVIFFIYLGCIIVMFGERNVFITNSWVLYYFDDLYFTLIRLSF